MVYVQSMPTKIVPNVPIKSPAVLKARGTDRIPIPSDPLTMCMRAPTYLK